MVDDSCKSFLEIEESQTVRQIWQVSKNTHLLHGTLKTFQIISNLRLSSLNLWMNKSVYLVQQKTEHIRDKVKIA